MMQKRFRLAVVIVVSFVLIKSYGANDQSKKLRFLIEEQNREEALNWVLENKKTKSHLQSILFLFFTNKAQHLYELALSMYIQDPKGALKKINDALKIEPLNGNLKIFEISLLLRLNRCSQAEKKAKNLDQYKIYLKRLELLEGQILYCQNKEDKLSLIAKGKLKNKKSMAGWYWMTEMVRPEKMIRPSRKGAVKMPDSLYDHPDWNYLLGLRREDLRETHWRRYLHLCQEASIKMIRNFKWDPWLCGYTEKVKKAGY